MISIHSRTLIASLHRGQCDSLKGLRGMEPQPHSPQNRKEYTDIASCLHQT